MIRLARAGDLAALRDIEIAAGAGFRHLGMDFVADADPPSLAALEVCQRDARAWVAVDAPDRPIGYLIASRVDGDGHIAQVSVSPDHAGQGLGRSLIETAAAWATARHLPALTLTTYAEVPWNGPYYRRLGFFVLDDDQIGPELRAIRDDERTRGFDQWPRVAMRRLGVGR